MIPLFSKKINSKISTKLQLYDVNKLSRVEPIQNTEIHNEQPCVTIAVLMNWVNSCIAKLLT